MAAPLKSLIIATVFSGFISLSFSHGEYLKNPAAFARCMYGERERVCVCTYDTSRARLLHVQQKNIPQLTSQQFCM